jgi:GTP cyclohydrolase II
LDGSQKDGSLGEGSEDVLEAAAEFVEAVATADQMLNATPVSALEPLSGLTGGVPWELRTRRALRAIQHETAILKCHSRDREGLLSGLWWMGEDGLKQMQSKLKEFDLELKERLLDLDSLPDDLSDPTDAIISQRRVHQDPVAISNGSTESDVGSVVPSSKRQDPTEPVDRLNVTHAREQLRPYVEIPAFREYLKGQILKWELWHRSHTEEINEYEGLRDKSHRELKELQGRDFRQSDDPAEFDPLGHAEICYENYRDIAAGLKDDPEYKLVADREPVLYKEASVATIVALFWCDINDSTLLVPEYDFLEPEGSFIEHVRKQWRDPIDGRYKHILWFVDAAIHAYESRIVSGGVEETGSDSIVIVNASQAIPEANQALQVNPPISEVTPPHVPTASTDDSLDESRIEGCSDKRVESPPRTHRHTAKERESAFDEAISGYAISDWKRDDTLNNKAWRVRSKVQAGELFGDGAKERGWYQSRAEKRVIKKDNEGVWVYLTASHSEELKKFFSTFVA